MPSGTLDRVALVRTDVSVSIFRVLQGDRIPQLCYRGITVDQLLYRGILIMVEDNVFWDAFMAVSIIDVFWDFVPCSCS
jgi:hypothetical protein